MELKKITFKLHQETYEQLQKICKKENQSMSETIRRLIENGLSERVLEKNTDLIADLVRKQVDVAMTTHVDRLASISAKSGIMSATATFLNVQALQELAPDKKKSIVEFYDSARKKAVAYMSTRTHKWVEKNKLKEYEELLRKER
ncbi:MAG: ribbon-helix-helix protein, CopG family [Clostridiales bacterium]|nr:ribbon-helix-helix protein, CopG family [Clostridiales bacterium]